jgi:uncharacterized membrane protein
VKVASWHKHPAVRSGDQLTFGERAADQVRNGMGSWPFVILFLGFMALWAIVNSAFYLFGSHGKHGFDPYPYILLNLMLSMVAGLQGAILLIAAKRADSISAELAQHTYEVDQNTLALTQAVHDLTKEVHEQIVKPKPASRARKA